MRLDGPREGRVAEPMSSPDVRRLRGLLVASGLLAGLFIIEGAGRLARLLPSRPSREYLDLTRAIGPLPPPFSQIRNASTGEFAEDVRFNALGFRGPETDFPGGDRRRILVLGDSYTAAWQVRLKDRWSDRLAGLRPDWATLNLGMPNWGTDQEYLTLRHYPLSRRPNQVLLMFFPGNDVSDNALLLLTGHSRNRPYFRPEGPESADPLDLREIGWRFRDPLDVPSGLPPLVRLRSWLHVRSVIYRAAGDARREWFGLPPLGKEISKPGGVPVEAGVFEPTKVEAWETAWRITESLLLRMKDTALRSGAKFAVVLVPLYPVIQPELTPVYMKGYGSRFDLALPARRLTTFALRHDVAMLDLTSGFLAYRRERQGSSLFYRRDKHFTPQGHCLASILIANWLDPGRASEVNSACNGDRRERRPGGSINDAEVRSP